MTALPVAFPTGPMFDVATGDVTPSWRAFFLAIWRRTGGAPGIVTTDTSNFTTEIQAETTAREIADANLTASIAQERSRAETAEIAISGQVSFETFNRQQATQAVSQFTSATYLSIAGLRAAWAGLDLSVLPATDPGSGKPWLDGNVLSVGSGRVPMELESSAGRWLTEAGTGAWEFG